MQTLSSPQARDAASTTWWLTRLSLQNSTPVQEACVGAINDGPHTVGWAKKVQAALAPDGGLELHSKAQFQSAP